MYIVDKVQREDIETCDKLMRWSEKKFEHKVLEKVSTKLAIRKVDLSNLTIELERILKLIHSFNMKLCDVELFTLENLID